MVRFTALVLALMVPAASAGAANDSSMIKTEFGLDADGSTTGGVVFESAISDDISVGVNYKHGDKRRVEEIFCDIRNQATPFGTTTSSRVKLDPEDNAMEAVVKVERESMWAKFDLKSEREQTLEGVELSAPLKVAGNEVRLQPYVKISDMSGHVRAFANVADTDVAVKVYHNNGPAEVSLKRKLSDDTTVFVDATPQDKVAEVEVEHKVGKHVLTTRAGRAADAGLRWINSGIRTVIGEKQQQADILADADNVRVRATTNIGGQNWMTTVKTPWGAPKKTSVSFSRDFLF